MKITGTAVDLGILVRDIEPMLAFYCDTLGWPKAGEVTFPGGRTQHRIAAGESLIKLMQFPDGEAPPAGEPGRMSRAGIRYFTVRVHDLPGVVGELEAKGANLVVPLREARPGVWIAMVEDPEGNTVELLEERS
ncbi:MAG: VOC family protein [Dehalococcoidia bacterium]